MRFFDQRLDPFFVRYAGKAGQQYGHCCTERQYQATPRPYTDIVLSIKRYNHELEVCVVSVIGDRARNTAVMLTRELLTPNVNPTHAAHVVQRRSADR
jgi:hypothetical protein